MLTPSNAELLVAVSLISMSGGRSTSYSSSSSGLHLPQQQLQHMQQQRQQQQPVRQNAATNRACIAHIERATVNNLFSVISTRPDSGAKINGVWLIVANKTSRRIS